jgi:hypothetical protein
MSKAAFAGICVVAYCKERWPYNFVAMCDTVANDFCHRFEGFSGSASHKYLPEIDEINKMIGAREGAGVYAYASYNDGSSLLFTCEHGIATIDERGLTLCR